MERARSAAGALGKARLFLGFNRRFDPSFRALRQKLQAGAIGSLETLHIISHDPAPPPVSYIKVSGGLFKDMTIHDFDVARWLLAEPVVEVYAMAACLVDPAIGAADDIDTAKVLLRTASGQIALISNTRRSGYGYDQRIEAFGSGGSVRVDNLTTTSVAVWDEEGATRAPFQNFFLDRYAEAYRLEMEHFAAVLRRRGAGSRFRRRRARAGACRGGRALLRDRPSGGPQRRRLIQAWAGSSRKIHCRFGPAMTLR